MALLDKLRSDDDLTPAKVWRELDDPTRRLAAQSIYDGPDPSLRREANLAIAKALRFREAAVQRLPKDKRTGYLVGRVHPDESLAASLLMALHLNHRAAMLETFLDEMGIPQTDGLIQDDYDLDDADTSRFQSAMDAIYDRFPRPDVEVYVASLIAMEPEVWGELAAFTRDA